MARSVILCLVLTVVGLATLWCSDSARAQTAAITDVSGIWLGSTREGLTLELRVTQDSGQITGDGYLQPPTPGEPLDFSFTGELTGGRLGLLQAEGRTLTTGTPSVMTLELAFAGEQAQVRLVDGQANTVKSLTVNRQASPSATPTTPLLRLWNHDLTPFTKYDPPETYHIDFDITKTWNDSQAQVWHMHFEVKLAGSLLTELAGSWKLDERDDSRGVRLALNRDLQFSQGRVAAWNYVASPETSVIKFKTPDTISVLSTFRFSRLSAGNGASDEHKVHSGYQPSTDVMVYLPDRKYVAIVPDAESRKDTGGVGYKVTLVTP